jgi:hypothetical protein
VQLVVSDPFASSTPSTVTVATSNIKPVANAGNSKSAVVGDTVTLDGSGSSDANGNPLTYQWNFTAAPSGSSALIVSPTAAQADFVPDLPGAYVAQLIVNDGLLNSDPSTVQIEVVSVQTALTARLQDMGALVGSLDSSVFKNAGMKNRLINKINAVTAKIEKRRYRLALNLLRNGILKTTNGCASLGRPDRNDWIRDCASQAQVYNDVSDIIAMTRKLR